MGYNSVKLVADTIRAGTIDTSAVVHDQPTGFAVMTRENADQPDIAAFTYPADLSACPTGAAPVGRHRPPHAGVVCT